MTNHKTDFRRNIFRTAAANFAVPLVGFATAPVLARVLGVEGRGELAAVTAPLLLVVAVATLGIPEAATFYIGRSSRVYMSVVRASTIALSIAGLCAAAGLFLIAPILVPGDHGLADLIRLSTVSVVPTIILSGLRGIASGVHAWPIINYEKYINGFLRAIGIFGFALLGSLNVTTALLAIVGAPLLAGVAYLGLKSPSCRQTRRISAPELMNYGSRVWIGSMSGLILSKIDQVLMIPLSGAIQLGLYAAAATMSDLALLINNAVRDVVFASESGEQSTERLQRAARISFLISGLIAAVMCSTAFYWFPLVFGEEFAQGVPVVIVLTIAAALGVPGSVAGAGLSARGRPGLRSIALLIAATINIVLLLFLLPAYGALGAAVATLVGNLVAANVNIMMMKRVFRINVSGFYAIRKDDILLVLVTLRGLTSRAL